MRRLVWFLILRFFIKKIVLENSSYKHIQRIISIYDVCGISSNGELCVNERESVLRTYFFQKMVYEALESATHMKQQPLYALFEELCHTRRFQYRIKPILLFLLKLNSFFSKRHYKCKIWMNLFYYLMILCIGLNRESQWCSK